MSVQIDIEKVAKALKEAAAKGDKPVETDLYGGAITVHLPASAVNAEIMRPVPDTQEVFVIPHRTESLIVEPLEMLSVEGTVEIAKAHFNVIAEANEISVTESTTTGTNANTTADTKEIIQNIKNAPPSQQAGIVSITGTYPILVTGWQRITKSKNSPTEDVLVCLAIWRIQDKKTDLVMTVNAPIGEKEEDKTAGVAKGLEIWKKAADTLKIKDMSLFV